MRLSIATLVIVTASSTLGACADEPRGGYRDGSEMRSERGYGRDDGRRGGMGEQRNERARDHSGEQRGEGRNEQR